MSNSTTSMEVMIQIAFDKFHTNLKFKGKELDRDTLKDLDDLEINCVEATKDQRSTEAEEWYENGYESGYENGREAGYDDGHDDGYHEGRKVGLEGFECIQ